MAKFIVTHPDGSLALVNTPLGSPVAKLGIIGWLLRQYTREQVALCRIQRVAVERDISRNADWLQMVEAGQASGLKVIK